MHRKHFKGRVYGIASKGNQVTYGTFGLQTLTPTRLTAKQIESARVVIVRGVRKVGKMWMRVFPDLGKALPFLFLFFNFSLNFLSFYAAASSKPAEVRMGKGKGMVDHYYARVKAERVIFEVDGIPKEVAQAIFKVAGSKLPVRTRLIEKAATPVVTSTTPTQIPLAGTPIAPAAPAQTA